MCSYPHLSISPHPHPSISILTHSSIPHPSIHFLIHLLFKLSFSPSLYSFEPFENNSSYRTIHLSINYPFISAFHNPSISYSFLHSLIFIQYSDSFYLPISSSIAQSPFIRSSIYLPINFFIQSFSYLPIHPSIYPSIHLLIYPFIYLSINPFIHSATLSFRSNHLLRALPTCVS